MAPAGVQLAQSGEGIEVLEQRLGQRGEVPPPADVVQIAQELTVGPTDRFPVAVVEDPGAFQMIEVPEELLPVEVRQGPPLLWIHGTPGLWEHIENSPFFGALSRK